MMLALGLALAATRSPGPWWPPGATFAADFAVRRYMRNGLEIAEADAISVLRSGPAWSINPSGTLVAHAANETRFVAGGLLVEAQRTRLSLAPVHIGAAPWTNNPGTTSEALPAEGLFAVPARIISGGQEYHRRNSTLMDLTAGAPVRINVRYRQGTSPNFRIYLRSTIANVSSVLSGPCGAITSTSAAAGALTGIVNTALPDGHELEASFTPISTQNDWQICASPSTEAVGEFVEVLGCQVVGGNDPTSWILGDAGVAVTRQGESLTLNGLSFPSTANFRFADATGQTLAIGASTFTVLAQTLSHRIIQSVAISA